MTAIPGTATIAGASHAAAPCADEERRRAANYPIARWYLRPLAAWLVEALAATSVRPWHLTGCGLVVGLTAAILLGTGGAPLGLLAALVLLAWFFDRADGQLARRQQTESAWGAWLDANVDELLDVAWHVALALAIVPSLGPRPAFVLLAAFLAGKYLFMYGLHVEPAALKPNRVSQAPTRSRIAAVARQLYHAPGNADVRLHLLVMALATGLLTAELAFVAAYYNLRWIVRYALVAQRLRGAQP